MPRVFLIVGKAMSPRMLSSLATWNTPALPTNVLSSRLVLPATGRPSISVPKPLKHSCPRSGCGNSAIASRYHNEGTWSGHAKVAKAKHYSPPQVRAIRRAVRGRGCPANPQKEPRFSLLPPSVSDGNPGPGRVRAFRAIRKPSDFKDPPGHPAPTPPRSSPAAAPARLAS